jgi:hypothetical protein
VSTSRYDHQGQLCLGKDCRHVDHQVGGPEEAPLPVDEATAVRELADAARAFARFTPRKNPTGPYGRALAELLEAARVFSEKSDETWAGELVAAREGHSP